MRIAVLIVLIALLAFTLWMYYIWPAFIEGFKAEREKRERGEK